MGARKLIPTTEAELVELINMTGPNRQSVMVAWGSGALIDAPGNEWAIEALYNLRHCRD